MPERQALGKGMQDIQQEIRFGRAQAPIELLIVSDPKEADAELERVVESKRRELLHKSLSVQGVIRIKEEGLAC
jgi:CRISPR/Cas system-associated protein Csm6